MIIINLKGGLGNQMFQYACGRSLAFKKGTNSKIDSSGYRTDNFRSFDLNNFNIEENLATTEEIRKNKYPYGPLSKLNRFIQKKVCKQNHIGWEPKTIQKIEWAISEKKDIYLDGYWQSYKYFEDNKEIVIKDFSLRLPLETSHPELIEKIKNLNTVSLSVRRTDYLDPQNLKTLGICSPQYYQKAIALIKEKVPNPHFFVFSDDPGWVKENINFGSSPVNYEADEKLTNYQAVTLMAKCQHNIIANSSFSWWGAWLNQNPNKIVIAPDIWFTNGSIKIDDIIPPTWNKLPR